MPFQKDKILQFNQYMKSDKIRYITGADLESPIKKIDGCKNNPEKSSTTKIGELIGCRCLTSAIWDFGNKHTFCLEEDCMKKFCASLREHATNKINFKKKKTATVNQKRAKIPLECNSMLHLWKIFSKMFANNKNYRKIKDHCHITGKYRGEEHSIGKLRFNVPREIPVVFHNGSNYGCRFIIKELANVCKRQF